MSYRAAVILIQDNKIALIERHRANLHYFTFPGGHIEEGESPQAAAVRETFEELGLQVVIKSWVALMVWMGKMQYYYLVESIGGTFGTGKGDELSTPNLERGSYLPVWMAVPDLLKEPVLPSELAELVTRFVTDGWPDKPIIITGSK